jgi:hypothetical protein
MKEAKHDFKHLKTTSMAYINIKVYPPWYARGTPVTNPRDGPAGANGALPLFAFREMPPDNVKIDADRSIDAVRSEERSAVRSGEAAVHFDLSACVAPDNVKMVMDNVKMLDDDTIDIYILKRTKIK